MSAIATLVFGCIMVAAVFLGQWWAALIAFVVIAVIVKKWGR